MCLSRVVCAGSVWCTLCVHVYINSRRQLPLTIAERRRRDGLLERHRRGGRGHPRRWRRLLRRNCGAQHRLHRWQRQRVRRQSGAADHGQRVLVTVVRRRQSRHHHARALVLHTHVRDAVEGVGRRTCTPSAVTLQSPRSSGGTPVTTAKTQHLQWSHLVRTAPRPACDVDHQQGIRSSRTACAGKEPRDDKPSGKAKLQGVTKVCSASPMYPARVPKHYVRQVVQLRSATQQGRASLTNDPHFLLHNTHDSRHVSRGLKAKCDFRKTDSYPGVAPQSERV